MKRNISHIFVGTGLKPVPTFISVLCLLSFSFFSLGMGPRPKPVPVTTSWWLSLDLGKTSNLSKITILWDSTYGSTNYTIQGSLDNSTWVNLQNNLSSAGGTAKEHALSGSYRYLRIYINKAAKNSPIIYETKLYGEKIVLPPDTTPPTGSIKINNGAQFANSANVTLNFSAQDEAGGSGLSQMQLSNDSANWSTPEACAATKAWTLPPGDGTKAVYVRFKDAAGNWSNIYLDTILKDTVPPAVPTISSPISPTSIGAQAITGTKTLETTAININSPTATAGPVTYPTQATYNCMLSNLGSGANNISVTAADTADNTSAATTASIIYNPIAPKSFLNTNQYSLLRDILNTHLNYFLSSDAITGSGLPLGAYKEGNRGRYNYSNPTEWGYTLLAWLIAAENNRIAKSDATARIENALNTIQGLQNNPQQNYKGLFYPYYYVVTSGGSDLAAPYHDANVQIPSIDNGFLYTSLFIVEGWAKSNGLSSIQDKASVIKNNMNFRMFLHPDKLYMSHLINAADGQISSSKWDVYADEGGMMAWIVYISGSVTLDEYKTLINSMLRPARFWNGITVEEAAWFNAMFTWGVRSWSGFPAAAWETGVNNLYSSNSFAQAVKAHLAFGAENGVYYPAFSDAMTQPGMVGSYTPPNISNQIPAGAPAHIVPHAFFVPFCIGPDLDSATLTTLIIKITDLKNDSAGYYHYGQDAHKAFGFEVTASPAHSSVDYAGVESRYVYETLSNAYIALSLFQGLNINDGKPALFHYAGQLSGYADKVKEVLGFLYQPVDPAHTRRVPQDYPSIQAAIDAAKKGDTILVASGTYKEKILLNKSGITLRGTGDPIIQGTSGSAVISCEDINTYETVIEGFKITGGKYGIRCLGGVKSLKIDNNIITRNTSETNGFGIYLDTGDFAVIQNNDITYSGTGIYATDQNTVSILDNNFYYCRDSGGGGVYFKSKGNALIRGNTFTECWDGAINIYANSRADIIGNKISSNGAWDNSPGLNIHNSTATLKNNIISNNWTSYFSDSCGLLAGSSAVDMFNNVFYKNANGRASSAVRVYDTNFNAKNNIFYKNTGGENTIFFGGSGSQEFSYNDLWDNTAATVTVGISLGTGSITADPLFVDLTGFHLKSGSPCVNTGDPAAQYNDKDGSRNDMGIYGGPDSL